MPHTLAHTLAQGALKPTHQLILKALTCLLCLLYPPLTLSLSWFFAAFVSWMKFYSTFPKELKPIFNVRIAHMGHFAKSFALKEAPTKFAHKHAAPKAAPPTNRLTYTER